MDYLYLKKYFENYNDSSYQDSLDRMINPHYLIINLSKNDNTYRSLIIPDVNNISIFLVQLDKYIIENKIYSLKLKDIIKLYRK